MAGLTIPVYSAPAPAAPGANGTVDPTLLNSTVSSILGLKSEATQDQANAQAQTIAAQGAGEEASAYDTASAIATGNAAMEGYAGQLETFQQQLQVNQTIGAQKAAQGAAGFGEAGTALDLMTSSYQQGALGAQMIALQTQLTEGGYNEEAAAANAEAAVATAAQNEALSLANTYSTQANNALANETAGTTDLMNYLKTVDPNNTSGNQQLVKDITAGNVTGTQLDVNNLALGLPVGGNGNPGGPTVALGESELQGGTNPATNPLFSTGNGLLFIAPGSGVAGNPFTQWETKLFSPTLNA